MLTQQVSELQSALVQLVSINSTQATAAPNASLPELPAAVTSPAADVISTMLSHPAAVEAVEQFAPNSGSQTPLDELGQLGADFAGAKAGSKQSSGPDLTIQPATADTAASGPPPKLVKGSDDIFWISQLHSALTQQGFSIDEDELDCIFFGDATENALLTFQVVSHAQ